MSSNKPEEQSLTEDKSLARQINSYWLNSSLSNFVSLDIIAIFSSVIAKIAVSETRHGIKEILIPRYFEVENGEIIYHFAEFSENFTDFFMYLAFLAAVISAIQIIMLIKGSVKGGREARRILSPINDIAVSAVDIASSEISAVTIDNEREEHLSDLQHAIDKIDPSANVHIHTGNSDLKGLEDAVNSLIDRMTQSYMRQAQFVNDASHELRTPIAVIRGYADMLDRWGKTDKKVLDESVWAIKNESEHITELVEQLLFLARGDNGKMKLEMDIFSLSDMLEEVCAEYELIDKNHSYVCTAENKINAFGCPSMIKQTVRILTDNAKKYTPDGGEITLRARRTVRNDVCFDVIDTGIGMEQSEINHIFERFYRADPARARGNGGSGLGLSIAKMIIDYHGGSFEVSSCVGIGTRITVILPRLDSDSEFTLNDEKLPEESVSFTKK